MNASELDAFIDSALDDLITVPEPAAKRQPRNDHLPSTASRCILFVDTCTCDHCGATFSSPGGLWLVYVTSNSATYKPTKVVPMGLPFKHDTRRSHTPRCMTCLPEPSAPLEGTH